MRSRAGGGWAALLNSGFHPQEWCHRLPDLSTTLHNEKVPARFESLCRRSVKAARTLAALVAATAAFSSADAAHAVPVVVNGTTYDVTTFTGSYNSNSSRFTTTEMPWFGDGSLAEQFAIAVGAQLGTPVLGTNGPLFAYSTAIDPTFGSTNIFVYSYNSTTNPPAVKFLSAASSFNITYAVASAQAPSAVPGPLPLFGAAAAFGMSRRLRRRIKLSA